MTTDTSNLRDAIEDRILTGALRPGTRLDEASLAEEFGVSRTPIRQALFHLAATGLVEHFPRRGAFVIDTGPVRLREMFEVMAELEALCARNAARRATQADLQSLDDCHDACCIAAEAGDSDTYYYANEAFHEAIRLIGGNGFLHLEIGRLQKQLQAFRRLQLRARARVGASLREHADILQAIKAAQPGDAAEAMRTHIAIQNDQFTDMIATLQRNQPHSAA
ncbi:GntR family transcriptional regulator [Loktanella sp. M215]|uniref:GntR family transcriptional regulator n=1 Tax=Loktanella sp. M215 TaxID=2675431 RepID=UPI001F3492BB|nr:FCD domain-containing protein [Loktanella sp. M215]